jgi:hypothetical protein
MSADSTRLLHPAGGDVRNFQIHQGPERIEGDVKLNRQFFTYEIDAGLVAGSLLTVMFTIERPAKDVWPYFKDFNLWQNVYSYFYSGVIGDLEGQEFFLTPDPNERGYRYEVIRVIPEHVMVFSEPVPGPDEDVSVPGLGVVRPGFHAFMLNEHAGQTVVTGLMQHASLMADASGANEMSAEEALAPWAEMGVEGVQKWAEVFIPTLKRLVEEGAEAS